MCANCPGGKTRGENGKQEAKKGAHDQSAFATQTNAARRVVMSANFQTQSATLPTQNLTAAAH